MTPDIELFLTKSEMLRVHFDEIRYEDFYNDLFPVGAFETKGQFDENKGEKHNAHYVFKADVEKVIEISGKYFTKSKVIIALD